MYSRRRSLIILLWIVVRWLASPTLSSLIISKIRKSITVLGSKFEEYWEKTFRQKKSHEFFVHLDEELEFGTPFDFSAAPFESLNKHLKGLMTPSDTRSFDSNLLKLFLIRKQWEADAQEALKVATPAFSEVCKHFKLRQPKKSSKYHPPPTVVQNGDNSYILFEYQHARRFGRITKVENNQYHVRRFYGKGLVGEFKEYVNADTVVQNHIGLFSIYGEFIIRITRESQEVLIIEHHQILAHCAFFRTDECEYLVSLEYRGSHK